MKYMGIKYLTNTLEFGTGYSLAKASWRRFTHLCVISFFFTIHTSAQAVYSVKGFRFKETLNEKNKCDHYLETDEILNELIAIQVLAIRDSVGCKDDIQFSSQLPILIASHISIKNKPFLSKKKIVRLEFHSKEFYDDEEVCIEMARRIIKDYPQLLEIELHSFSAALMCLDGNALIALEFNDQYEYIIYNP
jgi:hypothetical protein